MGNNLRPGQPVREALTSQRINGIQDVLRALCRGDNVVAGPGVRKTNVGTATILTATPRGDSTASHPYRVSNASAGGAVAISVRLGLLNSIVPTLGGGDTIDASPAPTLGVGSDYDGWLILATDTNADGIATAADLFLAEEIPENTSARGHLPIARVQTVAGALVNLAANQLVFQTLRHRMCGAAQHDFWGV